jgi:hypothetical protein
MDIHQHEARKGRNDETFVHWLFVPFVSNVTISSIGAEGTP